jgi:ankyrin repeat protein
MGLYAALSRAVYDNKYNKVVSLLANGASPNPVVQTSSKGSKSSNSRTRKRTPLMTACALGNIGIVFVLLHFGARPDIRMRTPFGDWRAVDFATCPKVRALLLPYGAGGGALAACSKRAAKIHDEVIR